MLYSKVRKKMSNVPQFQEHKLLKDVSTFSIGGPARLFIEVTSTLQMQEVLLYCYTHKVPFFILGKGSNCLFDDRGFDGLVIHNKIAYLKIEGTTVDVGAGYSFSLLGFKTAKKGLAGLEFASGIPATVGGAVFMNAGASGKETESSLREVGFVDEKGELFRYARKDLEFSYRTSSFQKMKGAVVFAKFELSPSSTSRGEQIEIIEYRTRTQPYNEPSIGCIFRNPKGISAGALIEKTGLKGISIGGAGVSEKHANFIVNKGAATAKDVLVLVDRIKEQVAAKEGIDLEVEMQCIPYQIK
jgi:UDP-N-acetylmuramate dehydrogenase